MVVSVVLHAGHQQVSFGGYLSRLLVVLLGFVVLAISIDYCLDAIGYRPVRSAATQDGADADR